MEANHARNFLRCKWGGHVCRTASAGPAGDTGLFHIQYQPFEVFPLGMVDVDGVVCRLMELVQYADVAATLCGGGKDGQPELVLVDSLAAGEGEDNASGAYFLEGDGIEPRVALQRIPQCVLVLCK